jgi:ADP-ribose pyrophosphatase
LKGLTVTKTSEELLYQGRILDLARETHRMPDQREARFEIIQHPGGAAALPILEDGRVILIRQFRPAAQDYILEIPAGRLESGETGADCIDRELQEEIGYRSAKIETLGYIYSSVGFCNEKIFLYTASELSKTSTALEPDEFIEPLILTLAEAVEKITSGEIVDAKTQVTLLRYALTQQEV